MTRIIECRVWCYQDPKTEIGDLWLSFAFDIAQVEQVKISGHKKSEFTYGKSVIEFKSGGVVTVDIDYRKMVELWIEYINSLSDPFRSILQ